MTKVQEMNKHAILVIKKYNHIYYINKKKKE